VPVSPTLADLVSLLERRFPLETAEDWDAVGLVCGRPKALVDRVLFAVDADPAVVREALDRGVQLIVTHHPLFLRAVHQVAGDSWKGRLVHDLIEAGVALYCAHTNADVAAGGVNDALAHLLGVRDTTPLDPVTGLGRVGTLDAPESLSSFLDRTARALPAAPAGLRFAGNLEAVVNRVAVCGGAGDSLLEGARLAGADVYVTADLRHHLAAESVLADGPALVDVGHWSSEWPWLSVAAKQLANDVADSGATVEAAVSSVVTDPWTGHRPFNS
jgi:dinuclear metal center YbgI/SA1388 family protein